MSFDPSNIHTGHVFVKLSDPHAQKEHTKKTQESNE